MDLQLVITNILAGKPLNYKLEEFFYKTLNTSSQTTATWLLTAYKEKVKETHSIHRQAYKVTPLTCNSASQFPTATHVRFALAGHIDI